MRVKLFNRPIVDGKADLPSIAAGLMTVLCVIFNIPLQF